MLMIRLQRIGRPKMPSYRFIVSEKTKDTQAGSIEILGTYHPVAIPVGLNLKKDRIQYWISKGAQCSDTVNNILIDAGVVKAAKRKMVTITKKRAVKLAEKNKLKAPAGALADAVATA